MQLFSVIRERQIQISMSSNHILIWMTKMKNIFKNTKYCWGCAAASLSLISSPRVVNCCNLAVFTICLYILNLCLTYGSENSTLRDTQQECMYIFLQTHLLECHSIIFHKIPKLETTPVLIFVEWMNKLWYSHTMKCCTAV